jgi:pyridoxal phosphate-dependent aminotransferase EpsN
VTSAIQPFDSTLPALEPPGDRIHLSPPHLGSDEAALVAEALASNWIAPLGPQVEAFETELAHRCGVGAAAALSSGTAGLHLALVLAGVQPGDRVFCSTLTFVASANPIRYVGAIPVFIDSHPGTWTLDPDLVAAALRSAARRRQLPKALVAVDIYGQCADYARIEALCRDYGVVLIEDAAESLGATAFGRAAGGFGDFGVLSFNGNKIITTSGGGALLAGDPDAIERARHLASQARDPAPHYQHSEIGYNYRLSNLLAALGRGQLRHLDERVAARRAVFDRYRGGLGDLPGIEFMPEASYGTSTRWLTAITIDAAAFGATREEVRLTLARQNIESRPAWKPLHLQPVFRGCRVFGGSVSERLFETGLCLPSGSALTDAQLELIVDVVRESHADAGSRRPSLLSLGPAAHSRRSKHLGE